MGKLSSIGKKITKKIGKKVKDKTTGKVVKSVTEKIKQSINRKDRTFTEKVDMVGTVITALKNTKDKLDNPSEKNHIKTWSKNMNFVESWPEDKALKKLKKSDIGIAFSGGGIRAATAALGQIRALNNKRFTSRVKYLGCNSGGSWFAIPWTYLPKKVSEKDYLCKYSAPEELNNKNLKEMFPNTWKKNKATNCPQALGKMEFANLKVISQMVTSDDKVFNTEHDETWGKILGEQLLKPFGMYNEVNKYACYSPETRDEILKRNKHLRKNDFQCVRDTKRPFLLVSATGVNWNMMAKFKAMKNMIPALKKEYPFFPYEFTSYYSGINRYYDKKKTDGVFKFGGGYVEHIGFDTKTPKSKDSKGYHLTRQRENYNRLSVQDMMATSGAAPGFAAIKVKSIANAIKYTTYIADVTAMFFGKPPSEGTKTIRKGAKIIKNLASIFPRYDYWPMNGTKIGKSHSVDFGDGGFLDNYGIISLLKRDVKNIVVFINSSVATEYSDEYIESLKQEKRDSLKITATDIKNVKLNVDMVSPQSKKEWRKSRKKLNALKIDSQMPCLFGLDNIKSVKDGQYTAGTTSKMQVFKSTDFATTVNGIIDNDKAKGLAYHYGTYEIKMNNFWGIPHKKKVNICFISLQKSHVWESQLKNWKKTMNTEDMKGFPNYGTFGYTKKNKDELSFKEQGRRVINLQEMSDKKIFTLSNYTTWVLKEIIESDNDVRKMFI